MKMLKKRFEKHVQRMMNRVIGSGLIQEENAADR